MQIKLGLLYLPLKILANVGSNQILTVASSNTVRNLEVFDQNMCLISKHVGCCNLVLYEYN